MRGWIRGNWRHLMVGLLCAAIVISGTALYLTYRQPEVCSLCGSGKRERYQAPVILNLTTGQSNEMRIYDPDLPFSEYEIAPIQTTGTFSFASCAGYTGRRDTCSHTCTVDLPIETKGLKVSHFCLDCRVLLKDHAENGFVLADLYVEDAIDIYDRYFKKALADTGAAPQVFSAKSIRTLGNLYLDHEDEFEKLRKHCGSRIEYPAAKILDMCFFEYGFQRDASSQEGSE